MIISHEKKFVFLHVKKAAGTYMSIILAAACGKDDVIAELNEKDSRLLEKYTGKKAQNYLFPKRAYTPKDWIKLIMKGKKKKLWSHAPAEFVKEFLGEKKWEEYYKFCMEREPLDKTLSYIRWRNRPEEENVKYYEERIEEPLLRKLKKGGFGIYTINGEVAVDRIYKFENIKEVVEELKERFSISIDTNFHAKRTQKKPTSSIEIAQKMSTDKIKLITEIFQWEYENIYPKEYDHILDIIEKRREI